MPKIGCALSCQRMLALAFLRWRLLWTMRRRRFKCGWLLIDVADQLLVVCIMISPNRVLHRVLRERSATNHSLRHRRQDRTLTSKLGRLRLYM